MLDDYFQNVPDLFMHEISDSDFQKLKADGYVVDGSKGGLLIGASHGDIFSHEYTGEGILVVTKIEGKYKICGEYEGGEYLLNKAAACDGGFDQATYNNSDDLDGYTESEPPPDISKLDLRLDKSGRIKSKLLFLDNPDKYSLTNRGSTQKHLEVLDKQNKKWEQFS